RENVLAIGSREHRQARNRNGRVLRHRLQQRTVMRQPALDRSFVEQVGIVVAVERQAIPRLGGVQEQVEIDEGFGVLLHARFQAAEAQIVADLFEIELHFYQRQAAGIARQSELAYQRAVGVALVLIRLNQLAAALRQQ